MFLLSGVRKFNVPADVLDGVVCFFLVSNLVEGCVSSSTEVEAHRMYHADIYVPCVVVNSSTRNRASPREDGGVSKEDRRWCSCCARVLIFTFQPC